MDPSDLAYVERVVQEGYTSKDAKGRCVTNTGLLAM